MKYNNNMILKMIALYMNDKYYLNNANDFMNYKYYILILLTSNDTPLNNYICEISRLII